MDAEIQYDITFDKLKEERFEKYRLGAESKEEQGTLPK